MEIFSCHTNLQIWWSPFSSHYRMISVLTIMFQVASSDVGTWENYKLPNIRHLASDPTTEPEQQIFS